MHVSIVGTTDGAPDAARKIDGASVPVDQMARLLRLIEDIACAANRYAAIEALVVGIAIRFPNAAVRAGIGQQRMKRFYDRRLGWLGSASSLHSAAEAEWNHLPIDVADCHIVDGGLVVCLPEIGGDGRLVVWIEGNQVKDFSLDWLVGAIHTLRVVFWERPVRAWMRLAQKLGLGSTFWFAIALSSLLVVAIWPAHYRIACTAKVEPLQQRLVATPFEATLLQSNVKPGDAVTEGQVLVVLDGRPLRLELESIESEIQQASKQDDSARATGKIAEAQQAALKVRQLSRAEI